MLKHDRQQPSISYKIKINRIGDYYANGCIIIDTRIVPSRYSLVPMQATPSFSTPGEGLGTRLPPSNVFFNNVMIIVHEVHELTLLALSLHPCMCENNRPSSSNVP